MSRCQNQHFHFHHFNKLRPAQVSLILLVAKAWDAITDPLVGFIVNRTNTRFGKMRPWFVLSALSRLNRMHIAMLIIGTYVHMLHFSRIIGSAPFAMISYILIWYVPSVSRDWRTVWYLFLFCSFQTFSTVSYFERSIN